MFENSLRKRGKPIDRFTHPAGDHSLLVKCGQMEVIEQCFHPAVTVEIFPPVAEEAHEVYHILEGSMCGLLGGQMVELTVGDTLHIDSSCKPLYFRTDGGIRFLCMTNQPTFIQLSGFIHELRDILARVEEKDPYTKDHGIRVQDWSYKIGHELGFPPERLEPLCMAALFHDVGKIKIPDHILNKPGRLSDEEFEQIKMHPVFGRQMMVGTILDEVADYIGQHHERLDGTGYPDGYRADRLSFEARIIAVSDVYDAITTDRPYRKGLPASEAVAELMRNRGTGYDERVVDALVRVLTREGLLETTEEPEAPSAP